MFCPSSNPKAPTRITLSQGQTPLKVEGLVPRIRDILCLWLEVNVAFGRRSKLAIWAQLR